MIRRSPLSAKLVYAGAIRHTFFLFVTTISIMMFVRGAFGQPTIPTQEAAINAPPANQNDAVELAMNAPALITPRALGGLFNGIARAGDRMVAVGERGRIVISNDNGANWQQVASPTSVTLTKVDFIDSIHGWAIGHMGVVLETSDGGMSWKKIFDGIGANKIMLTTAQRDLTAAPNDSTAQENLQSAQQFVSGGPVFPFLGLLPLTPKELILVGAFGMALYTSDGGVSWNSLLDRIPNPNGLHIYGIVASQSQLIFFGEQGLVVRGDLATGKFVALNPPTQGTLFGGLLAADGQIILYGLLGNVIETPDNGDHWQTISTNVDAGIDCGVRLADGTIVLGDTGGDILEIKPGASSATKLDHLDSPVTAIAQASDGSIIVGTLFGLKRVSTVSLQGRL